MKIYDKKSIIFQIIAIILMIVTTLLYVYIFVLIFTNKVNWNYNFSFIEKEDVPIDSSEIEDDEDVDDIFNLFEEEDNILNKYNGWMSYEPSKSILNTFNIVIPDGFTNDIGIFDVGSLNVYLDTNPDQIFSKCEISFGEIINYKMPARDLAQQISEYYGVENGVIEGEINGIKWYYFNYNFFGTVDAYLTERKSFIFLSIVLEKMLKRIFVINICLV